MSESKFGVRRQPNARHVCERLVRDRSIYYPLGAELGTHLTQQHCHSYLTPLFGHVYDKRIFPESLLVNRVVIDLTKAKSAAE